MGVFKEKNVEVLGLENVWGLGCDWRSSTQVQNATSESS